VDKSDSGLGREGRERSILRGGAEPCVHGLLLGERLSSVHEDMAEIRRRLERLETVLTRGMAVLLANLTGIVLMLAKQFLLG
jgi:hypothetical protein